MTTIDLTPAELELIQAKRTEAEKVQAENEAKLKQEIAGRLAMYQKNINNKVAIAKRNLDLMRTNWNSMLSTTKGNNAWHWSTATKTIEEVVRVYDRTINDYVTHDTLTATIEIATLTNGNVIIQCQDTMFVSNISKDRRSRWNQYPKPHIGSWGKGYTGLKKCLALAEELMEEMQAMVARNTAHLNLQHQAIAALGAQYPTATVDAYTHWDRTTNKDIPMVRVRLHNGVTLILNPYTKNAEGIIQYGRHSVTYPEMDTLNLVGVLNGIAI